MKPINIGGHTSYRQFVSDGINKLYSSTDAIPQSTRMIIKKFRRLDLSRADVLMQDKYSIFGPKPRLPSCMLRSLLLSIAFKFTSIPSWVNAMRVSPLYAILSGFPPDDTPGVGTFYDFIGRLWDFPSDNLKDHIQPLPAKLKKPKVKGQKADPVEKESVADLVKRLSEVTFSIGEEAYATLFTLFKDLFIDESVRLGVIDPRSMRISGDGTPVVTSHRLRSHHACDCIKKGIFNCTCDRYFSQPDCNVGWDSSRDLFYVGYDLYVLTDTSNDLPLFPLLNPASKHDSHAFCEAYFRFKSYLPNLKASQLLLDSAHDAMAIYNLCKDDSITPFIDLNQGNAKKTVDYHGVTIGPDGIPVCPIGKKMKFNGNDLQRQYAKYKCPCMNSYGKNITCTCETPCSSAKYGRTCSIPLATNIRLYNTPGRDSDEWNSIYNSRTASERSNKREKIDYLLESGKHRSSKMWYVRTYLIMMMQHLDSWPDV